MDRFYFHGFHALLLYHLSPMFALLDKVCDKVLPQNFALQSSNDFGLDAIVRSQRDCTHYNKTNSDAVLSSMNVILCGLSGFYAWLFLMYVVFTRCSRKLSVWLLIINTHSDTNTYVTLHPVVETSQSRDI